MYPDEQRPLGWWLALHRASVREGEPAPLSVLWEAHARPGVLGARYLEARAHLLCGRWGEASKELQALLPLLPQLRCALRSFGVSDVAMLQQTVRRARPRARPRACAAGPPFGAIPSSALRRSRWRPPLR